MSKNYFNLKPGAIFKVDFDNPDDQSTDEEFIMLVHVSKNNVVGILLSDDDINHLNECGIENITLPETIDYYMDRLFRVDCMDSKKLIDIKSIESGLECMLCYSETLHNAAAFNKLVSAIKKRYETKISIDEFEQQIWKVEGVKCRVINNQTEDDKITRQYGLIDPYPFINGIDGEKTVEDLMNTRIRPLLDHIVPMRWW